MQGRLTHNMERCSDLQEILVQVINLVLWEEIHATVVIQVYGDNLSPCNPDKWSLAPSWPNIKDLVTFQTRER